MNAQELLLDQCALLAHRAVDRIMQSGLKHNEYAQLSPYVTRFFEIARQREKGKHAPKSRRVSRSGLVRQ